MEKKRVYQIAKEFHVSSEALILMLKELKFSVKSHMSVVDENMLKAIKEQFEKQQDKALKHIQKKKEISEAIDKKMIVEEEKIEPPKHTRKKKSYQRITTNQKEQSDLIVKIPKKPKKKKEYGEEKKVRQRLRKRKKKVDMAAVQDSFKKTLASITSDSRIKPKKSRKHIIKDSPEDEQVVKVSEFVSVSELAAQMGVSVNILIEKSMELGMMVSINQRLDMDSIIVLANEFGYKVEKLGEYAEDMLKERYEKDDDDSELVPRPP
ncbi:MAG TPA: translation initiation factor IF-2 N-terminal domain-containing protein, partial [Candidatus Glassbacteria bacterium]|nr:translation initiation factor IF-2 N-terminal domain-containing protein [Candidatus Glassbacteria bacterium]